MSANQSLPTGQGPALAKAAESISLRLELTSSLSHLHHAVVAIRAWCELSDRHRGAAWKIELAVMEALTNIVVHAYHERAGEPISVTWSDGAESLVIEIEDHGETMVRLPDAELPAVVDEGGRGWPIIRACVDRVAYQSRDGINRLILEQGNPGT